ncbi:threonine synthase [Gemmatimonadetes bacterium T265]|nr:threonine synthase [Gemmatimonadetes bacterium T265]
MTTVVAAGAAAGATRVGWSLHCSACAYTQPGDREAGVCPECAQPLFAVYDALAPAPTARWDMWRYAGALPLRAGEMPVSLGEGLTPVIEVPALARRVGVARLWVKDEGRNPTASFKARGMSAAVTRARALGARGLVVPTAGNAGAALAAYGAAAGLPVRVYAPRTTPAPILHTVRAFGAELRLVDGHIGDAGRLARADAASGEWTDASTFREPYRVEGMKTMGYELRDQLGAELDGGLPSVVVYPTGGGEGTVGIWKAFGELRELGLVGADARLPRMIIAQSAGCAPLVRAFAARQDRATPWEDPVTYASGLRVPGPLGDRVVLRALAESGGDAVAVADDLTRAATFALASASGVDAAPEGGCALAALDELAAAGRLGPRDTVVLFNTGSGASYREAA